MDRLARMERADQENAAKLAQVSERLVQAERAGGESRAQLTPILDKLERIERQTTAQAPTVPQPTATGSLPDPKASAKVEKPQDRLAEHAETPEKPAREAVVAGWFLRGVHRGTALLESRRGLVEVKPGATIPGAGRVEAIEKRGREWVVVTSKGLITAEQW